MTALDVAGRTMAEELAKLLKVPVVRVNRPGAGTATGTYSVVKAKRDDEDDPADAERRRRSRANSNPESVTYDPAKDAPTRPSG